ncbi:FAD-binding protein [Streptomyces sp. AS58]|uniref:FAD-binding oxidoreductase n=1 Tax=Streptomyces cadmiisoli TaxID=2184053 RepID=A0A2Z4J540_9ACTN|nr:MULTISPECIES: FAD-binding oxidoreductase [Streptomyces]AWW40332.1 FAD-binding oxidoreductase [Streptomyces cadmiisoli]KOV68983.1 FAD-binding protein [Streptomyces sp. AS58]
MTPFSKARTALAALREDLSGDVFAPWDPGYDGARSVFNALIDRRPAVIARCAHEADVVRAVRFGRDLDLNIAVRGGGHSLAGMGVNDAGLVVDLRPMHGVTVDPAAEAARIGGGATTGHLDRATGPYGLATTGARVSTTGVAGCVLGGGSGWLERCCGPAADNLLGVELVTADGERTHANPDENPDLFRALHGAGGNFGVATALTLRLYEVPRFSVALVVCPPRFGAELTRAFRDVVESGPLRASGAVRWFTGRPAAFVPEPAAASPPGSPGGRLWCGALLAYAGDVRELRGLAEPLLALPHEVGTVTALPYAGLQRMFDVPPGLRCHWSAEYLTGAPDRFVDVFCARARSMPPRTGTEHLLFPVGAAVADGPAGLPLPYRGARWAVHPFAVWRDPAHDERCVRWVRDARADAEPWSTGAAPLNLVGDEGPQRVRAGLGAGSMRRLGELKRRHDPDNVFRFNHNIKPL